MSNVFKAAAKSANITGPTTAPGTPSTDNPEIIAKKIQKKWISAPPFIKYGRKKLSNKETMIPQNKIPRAAMGRDWEK